MASYGEQAEYILLKNEELIDQLHIFRIYLKLKQLVSLKKMDEETKYLDNEFKYLIGTQRKENSNLIKSLDYINLMERQGMDLYVLCLEKKLTTYMYDLRYSMAMIKLYLEGQNPLINKFKDKDNNHEFEVSFSDVLKSRQMLSKSQLVLENRRKGIKTWT